jgi:hypothetical protein
VAYLIQTAASVEAYIHGIEGFSEAGKRQVINGYLHDLAEHADHFLERYPLGEAPGGELAEFDDPFRSAWSRSDG